MAYDSVGPYPKPRMALRPIPSYAGLGITAPPPVSTVPGLPPSIAWAPKNLPKFNPADYNPKTFADAQFTRWAKSDMQSGIAAGRTLLSQKLGITLPALPSLNKNEIVDWTTGYVQANGVPTDLESGAKMVTALAHAQAQKLGVPPEYVAAANVVMNPPKTVAEGFAMVADLGEAYFMRFGIPLLQNELMSVSTNLAMVAQAIPIQFAIAGFDALSDGKLSTQEIAGIAVQAAAYACGLLLQAIGIPAPLGALLAGVIAQGLMTVADDVLHADDADTRARREAIAALEAQRQQLISQCATAAQQVWNKTQDYWEKVLVPIDTLLNQPLIAQKLQAAGGLRYYGRNVVTLPPGVTLPNAWPRTNWLDSSIIAAAADAEAAAKKAEATAKTYQGDFRYAARYRSDAVAARAKATDLAKKAAAEKKKPLYEYGFDCLWWEGDLVFDYNPSTVGLRQWYPANARPYPDGCLYFTRKKPNTPAGKQTFDQAQWMDANYWPNPTLMWERCAVARPPGGYSYDPPSFHASAEDAAHCLPTMQWAAQMRMNFDAFNATRKMTVRLTPYTDHTSAVRTKIVTVVPGAMVDGKVNAQAALMFWGAIRPATVWSQYSPSADASDVTQWKAFAYIDPSAIQVYKQDGSLTARLNINADYCDTNEWAAAVQTAAAAAALVQQDIIRTVAWQVGAEEAARQAKITKEAGDNAAAQTSAANAKVAWQQAAATTIAQQVARAQLQARAVASARQASGAFAAATALRLRFQTAQATAEFQRKALVVAGGVAAGALLFWLVSRKKRARQ